MLSHDGLRFDLRVVPPEAYGNLLQHFTGSKDHNVALRERRREGTASRSPSTASRTSRPARSFTTRDEGELYERLGYAFIPPELRENSRRARGGARAASCRRSSSSATCAATCTPTRPGRTGKATLEEMVDGGARARLRVPRGLRPLAAPARRPARAAGGGDRRAAGAASRRSGSCAGSRSTSAPTARSTCDDETLAGLDWVMASRPLRLRPRPDRARARGDGEPARRLRSAT